MSNFILMTDSTSDLPISYCRENDIRIISLTYIIDGVDALDWDSRSDDYQDFYKQLSNGKLSTTSQINTSQYIDFMTPQLEVGKDILYIAFSSGLSGSYQSANVAVETLKENFPERNIRVVDTLGASVGEGLIVMKAAQMRAAGESLDTIADTITEIRLNMHHWFTVDDLNYLKRGGRLSSANALIGSMLNIKPVLFVNTEGKLIPYEKARSRKRAIKQLCKKFAEHLDMWDKGTIGICHSNCLEDAELLKSLLEKTAPCQEIIISSIGAVIGSHVGAGTLGLFFWADKRN